MQPIVTIVTPLTGGPEPRQNLRAWVGKVRDLPIKLILVHDETNSQTRNEVSAIASLLPSDQVEVVNGNFGSPGGARNAGLELVDSEWVVFWDSDDVGEPENLIRIIETNSDASVVICAFTRNQDFGTGGPYLRTIDEERNIYLQMANQGGLWRYVIKRHLIKDLRFSLNMMGEDQQFLVGLNLSTVDIRKSSTVVYNYYYGSERHLTSNRKIQSQVESTLRSLREQLMKQNKRFNLFETAVYFKLLLSVCKYSPVLNKISATLDFLTLILLKRKVSFRHLGMVCNNLLNERRDNFRAR